ncbi:glycosyltransferase [Microbacterium oleivorans]|uniref:glycosyltransferase n=1 Tax=Microbacterium oleivorans TaxID=273677 RepID=UPI00203D8A58|nr:glycosyltransferase [Microbacterium oleivorans]MCM3697149.1 glycosyltransferase [Microbacterium oleivorans]
MQKLSVSIIGTRGYPSYYGGFETAVRHLAPFLCDAGWDVTVYGRAGANSPDDPDRDPRVGSRLTRGVESRSMSTLTFGLTASIDAAFRRRPSVALVMNVANGFYLPMLRASRIPTLVNVDGIEWDREKWGQAAKRMFRAGARLTAQHATELVFDARAIRDRWERDFGRSGTFIPYGGTAPGELSPPMGLTSGEYVLVVARFVPENTVPEFLRAVESIARDSPVVIVGSTGYGGELDEYAQRLDAEHSNVHWLGHVRDDGLLFALLQHAGVYFHGHSVGGTNPALVQAMACGAPVVARDTVYNREVLEQNALFVKPDPESIASGITELMRDPVRREAFREGVRRRSQREYTWDLVCERYEATLRRLAAGS